MYEYYKQARNSAWQTLIDCRVSSFPVDVTAVAHHYGIRIAEYSRCALLQLFNPATVSGDGFVTQIDDVTVIFLNDGKHNHARRRFTVGHELGHALLHHPIDVIHTRNAEIDSTTDALEMQANVFSRDLLMPSGVLAAMGITAPDEIMQVCDISRTSAEIRAERLALLRQRNMFGSHPLERQVLCQFGQYIQEHKK
ncbi:MAG: ImmA/IrrE family metallo-endopeptidase [Oscillospiraceae bacterium]